MTTTTDLIRSRSLGDRYSEWGVIGLTVLALILGATLQASTEGQIKSLSAEGITVEVPARWIANVDVEDGALIRARNSSGSYPTTYQLDTLPIASDASLEDAVVARTLQLGRDNTAFNVLSSIPATVNGMSAHKLSFAYVVSDQNVNRENIPVAVRGDEYIFLSDDGRIVAVQFTTEAGIYEAALPGFERFLLSVSF